MLIRIASCPVGEQARSSADYRPIVATCGSVSRSLLVISPLVEYLVAPPFGQFELTNCLPPRITDRVDEWMGHGDPCDARPTVRERRPGDGAHRLKRSTMPTSAGRDTKKFKIPERTNTSCPSRHETFENPLSRTASAFRLDGDRCGGRHSERPGSSTGQLRGVPGPG